MLTEPLAPYLLWAKMRRPAAIDLAGSNLLPCAIDDLPGARAAVDISAPNDNGFPPLVEAIARHYGVTAAHVVSGTGCSGANFVAIATLVGPGDEVLVEEPTYDPLIGACRLMGAAIRRLPRRFETRWRVDPDDVARLLTPQTRLVVLTSPHNPSGAIVPPADLDAVGRAAARVGAAVLVDEVYLDGANLAGAALAPTPSAGRLDGPFVATSSLTKSYGLAGLRCGWIICHPEIAERGRRTRDVVENAGNAPGDRLGALAFAHLPALAERARTLLAGNLARMRAFFDAHPVLEVAAPPAASVVFPRIAGVADAGPFVQALLERQGVAVAPGRFFGAPAHFRISAAGRPDVLERGLAGLHDALASLQPSRVG